MSLPMETDLLPTSSRIENRRQERGTQHGLPFALTAGRPFSDARLALSAGERALEPFRLL